MQPRISWAKSASFFLHNCSCFSLVFVLSELVFEALYLRVVLLRGKIQIGKLWLCPTKSWVAACLTCPTVIPVFSDKSAKVGTKLRCSAKNKIQIKLDFIPKWICTSQGPRPSCEEGREIEGPISGELNFRGKLWQQISLKVENSAHNWYRQHMNLHFVIDKTDISANKYC